MGALRLTALAVVVAGFGIAPAALLAEEPAPGPVTAPTAATPGQPPAATASVSTGVGTASIATPSARPAARSSGAATASAASASVRIGDYFFKPKDVTISAGESVTWKNTGKAPEGHTVTGDGFDSGVLKSGDTYEHSFSKAGSFDYVCTIHPNMHGTVIVTASASGGGSGGGGSSSSSGGGSSNAGGDSGVGFDNSDSSAGSGTDSSGGGSLPSTGLNLPLLAEIGLCLVAAGLLVRRLRWR